ncbi:MAG: DUF1566 domain-containing protein [Desulfovibrionales bacterium]|nr:DUF1566 domain-containing protein [Desulfovibrionales bacterium]
MTLQHGRHILASGQLDCFDARGRPVDCAGSGQDGEFRPGVAWPEPRFALLGHDLIQDLLTGLFWTRVAGLGDFPMSWAEALSAVAGMNRDKALGHADWRLPNRRELASLVSPAHQRPALPSGHPFIVSQTWYWTSTTASLAPRYAWHVHLEGGRMFYGDKGRDAMVWPVRGVGAVLPRTGQRRCWDAGGVAVACLGTGQDGELRQGVPWPEPRFTREKGGVHDALTGLLWTLSADQAGPCSWEQALHAAQGCREGGRNWRLPTIRELESLVDADEHSPALPRDHPFRDPREAYWSSTSSAFAPDWAYCLYLHKGAVGVGFKAKREFHAWFVALE